MKVGSWCATKLQAFLKNFLSDFAVTAFQSLKFNFWFRS